MLTAEELLSGRYSVQQIKKRADLFFEITLFIYFGFGLIIAAFYDTWAFAISIGGLSIGAYYIAKFGLKGSNFYHYIGSSAAAIFMAQFIYQMHGMLEMHFFAFVSATILISHQNWRLQVPLALIVVVHHAVFAYIQYTGFREIYFTEQDYMPLRSFIFHGLLATVIFGICGYWGYMLEERSKHQETANNLINSQLDSMHNNVKFADEISKGNLQINYQIAKDDTLGESLVKMRENLLIASKREERERYMNVGLARASEILRSENDDLQKLSDNILSFTVKYMEANQGGLFILNDIEKENHYLELTSTYAYNKKKYLEKEIAIGEGLIGQCFLEKESLYMTEVPESYVQITSGLGDATPTCILIVPLKFNEGVYGIMELASFKDFDESKREFVEKLCESIASTISVVKVNERTKRLLEETQQQTEMLRAQEEEMRQNMEELLATQEEIARKNKNAGATKLTGAVLASEHMN